MSRRGGSAAPSACLPLVCLLLVCLLLACLTVAAGAQQAGGAGQPVFLPPRFYVGDRAELRLRLELEAGLQVSEPQLLPEDPWFDLHGVQIDDRRPPGGGGEVRVRVFFTPFRPGRAVFPQLSLGDLSLEGIEVHTQPVIQAQEQPALRGVRAPLRLPFTALRTLGLLLAALAVPTATAAALRYALRWLRRLRELQRRRRPYARLQRTLQQLRAQAEAGEGRDFFILLASSLKRYLAERLGRPLMSATTAEIRPQLLAAGLEPSVAEQVHALLGRADLAKFSGRGGPRRDMRANLGRLERIAAKVEERYADVEP